MSKLKQIVACNQKTAEDMVPQDTWGCISIRSPEDKVSLHSDWNYILYLKFHDMTSFRSGYTLFSYEQANKIIDWIEEYIVNGKVDRLLVHCGAGVSRSQAVAYFIHEYYADHLSPLVGTNFKNKLVYDMLCYTYKQRNNIEEQYE